MGYRILTNKNLKGINTMASSWVIKNKKTGKILLETFNKQLADAINTNIYEVIPILEHLASINGKSKAGDKS